MNKPEDIGYKGSDGDEEIMMMEAYRDYQSEMLLCSEDEKVSFEDWCKE